MYFETEIHVQLVSGHVQLVPVFLVVLVCSVSHVLWFFCGYCVLWFQYIPGHNCTVSGILLQWWGGSFCPLLTVTFVVFLWWVWILFVGCVFSKVSPCGLWPLWCMAEILYLWVAVFPLQFGVVFLVWWLFWFHSWNSHLPVGPNSDGWVWCWEIELHSSDLHGLLMFWLCLFSVVGGGWSFCVGTGLCGWVFCRPCVPMGGQFCVWPWLLRTGVVPLFLFPWWIEYLGGCCLYGLDIRPVFLHRGSKLRRCHPCIRTRLWVWRVPKPGPVFQNVPCRSWL